ncbi:3-phosphoshikimate 1-carboxyvinyltransferase [Saccharothrix hoggarensis]|uniref:3-phosphoshikimate 1-carboxyvinyltransferase n=1 Tax=Saccharothrix hoggarensis TaxID=913853 RepID=A0ABW3R1X9_9PSEU
MTTVLVPGSKSVTARALFLSACADGTSSLRDPLRSDDTEAFREGLSALGYATEVSDRTWAVTGRPAGPPLEGAEVYCRDAGTAARFLPALVATGHGRYRVDASAQMRRRPMGPLGTALRTLGVDLVHEDADGHLPVVVNARGVKGGRIELDATVSSQFLTALLLMAPLTRDGLEIVVTGMVSRPYVDMTVRMMADFGVEVVRDGDVFRVAPQTYTARDYQVEPDASTASYFFAAAALTGRTVTVPGLGLGALQGDVEFVRVLERMGADVRFGATDITVTGTGELRGVEVNMRDISDTMPTLAAIAPFADGPVRIVDVGNTRVKECDRLDACATNLRRLGVDAVTGPDWIEIRPGVPRPALVDCHADHRIAMSFAVTGLRTPGLELDDPGCVRKTFPEFHEALADLVARWDRLG